eukprot:TRINITY_DN1313_c0_g1_i1.p1 TRINITY_DN1313_c0_g1~~TRINITY_DN1313_c0_g1_i1.p1  ORF type:complete len:2114 (+),score=427.23 TRINITY_DN1313_c0_g1_i1:68-6409(+)
MAVMKPMACMLALAALACVIPRLLALCLVLMSLHVFRLQPRKTLDMSWHGLWVAFKHLLLIWRKSESDRAALEKDIAGCWSPADEAAVFLSVRSGFDLLLTALELPHDSEVLFAPGITIPAMVQLVKDHGLRAVGLTPPSASQMLPSKLAPFVKPETRVLVITHLFGTVADATSIVREAKELGLFVVEDCAQAFLGSMPAGRRLNGSAWPMGFRGHDGTDASFTSFGNIKTMTALGGAIGRIRDPNLKDRMRCIECSWPVRTSIERSWNVLRAIIFKIFGNPVLYGLAEAVFTTLGFDFDAFVVESGRGFKDPRSVRQRPSVHLLELLLHRLRNQHQASFEDASLNSSVARRRRTAQIIIDVLVANDHSVVTHGDGANGWWLLPMISSQPQRLVSELRARGFDATCTSTQLRSTGNLGMPGVVTRPTDGKDFMDNLVYLPLSHEMSTSSAQELASAVLEVEKMQHAGSAKRRPRIALLALIMGIVLLLWPSLVQSFLPSSLLLMRMLFFGFALFIIYMAVARWLAAEPELQMNPEILKTFSAAPRAEGLQFCQAEKLDCERIDGAVLLTGSTGFVGGGILFSLLAHAEKLGVTRIILLVRRRSGKTVEQRMQELRNSAAFEELREAFDQLVIGLEGDVAERNFGWSEPNPDWPHKETLKAVLHCAGDVRFQQPIQQAALSLISATLQMQQLASRWGAKRFLFVSTAFVHAVPSATSCLEEKLVELRDFDAMELYRDAISHGSWALTALKELGFSNTYTFSKAIAEHLVVRACDSESMDVRIVRPSIVGPAWAFPWIGWAGDKPSTIIGGGTLLARQGLSFFRDALDYPCPVVPVDLVAGIAVRALAGARSSEQGRVLNASVDFSEASQVPSFKRFIFSFYQVLALKGHISLPVLGLRVKLMRWCDNAWIFWLLHPLLNILPMVLLDFGRIIAEKFLGLFGQKLDKKFATMARVLAACCTLPTQYQPFTSPIHAWRFRSTLRLPQDWSIHEYTMINIMGSYAFAQPAAKGRSLQGPSRGYMKYFRIVKVVCPSSALADAFLSFAQPKAHMFHSIAACVVRIGLSWMSLTVTVDASSLDSVTQLEAPLVLCPTHRSLLDFVIIGATCFQFRPLLPALQLPQVAADAEFSGLPFLGWALARLGAFFVRRGGGSVQPDPALRAKVGKVFHHGRPLEVFLEGLRSRGRRQLRLRTGLLKALRDISQRTVALVPLALSYELLPEDASFYRELSGLPRDPLRTGDLVQWAIRGLLGNLPPLGEARLRLGVPHTLNAEADLDSLVAGVQHELVELTSLTTLHSRALAELLELPPPEVLKALRQGGLPVHESQLRECFGMPLSEAERWPLALQAATLTPLRSRLPQQWAKWFVEGLSVREGPGTADTAKTEIMKLDRKDNMNLATVAAALSARLEEAETAAEQAYEMLRSGGMVEVTEEHLVQQLLYHGTRARLPAPLARGAASIVAGRALPAKLLSAGFGGPKVTGNPRQRDSVTPLWPAASGINQLSKEESLDRWGFKDTRFSAQYFDGKPAAQMTSQRYSGIGRQPLYQLWALFQQELSVPLNVRNVLPERALPELPKPAEGLEEVLATVLPQGRARLDAESRIRAGTGHGLADIWRLRTRELPRVPDAVVRPESEEEVQALLQAATEGRGFGVIPVGGRTNVTSATLCPPVEVDARPFVAIDMRGLSRIVWVNAEDGVAMIEAGVTGTDLKDKLSEYGVTMGMEPDSMEFSTLGGWIATRASGMKRSRYGNIEDMVLEVRLITPNGPLWQCHADPGAAAQAHTAIGRASTNIGLPGLVLGSEGCLGVVTSAVVRVRPLPEAVEYQSVLFPDWAQGAAWMREVARLPAGLRPASCRLMDQKQLRLAKALKEDSRPRSSSFFAMLQHAFLSWRGVTLSEAAAVTLVFEGTRAEVTLQKSQVAGLVSRAGGVWGGASSGEAGYALTFAIAYLRDFGLDYRILSESIETMAPWSSIDAVWPAVQAAVEAEHSALLLPGRPFMSCRMTQLYDEGAVLYMYLAVCTSGLAPRRALEAFARLEHVARQAAMDAGGCLSHHHGVGKLRASLLPKTQSPVLTQVLRDFKSSLDPSNVFAARNGNWAVLDEEEEDSAVEREPLDMVMH